MPRAADRTFDVLVVGLGTAGAATCLELARRGVSVCGLDARHPPHTSGSHHGRSRSVRRAYMEGTSYVPMAMRAWELWRRLEADAGLDLLFPTGNLTLGPEDGSAASGVLRSARAYGIAHEELTSREVRDRWPALAPPDDFVGVLETEAGVVLPEPAVAAMLRLAAGHGATLRTGTPVRSWRSELDRVVVDTSSGQLEAGALVIAAGARTNTLLAAPLIVPRRVPVVWVTPPDPAAFAFGDYPVNFWQVPASASPEGASPQAGDPWEVYSLPVTETGGAVKVAAHNHLAACDPDADPPSGARAETDPPRVGGTDAGTSSVSDAEIEPVRSFVRRFIPALADGAVRSERCFYATTADGEFHLGPVPGERAVFTGAFAGHGFKFAPVLGEILADLATGREPGVDLAPFRPDRTTALPRD